MVGEGRAPNPDAVPHTLQPGRLAQTTMITQRISPKLCIYCLVFLLASLSTVYVCFEFALNFNNLQSLSSLLSPSLPITKMYPILTSFFIVVVDLFIFSLF